MLIVFITLVVFCIPVGLAQGHLGETLIACLVALIYAAVHCLSLGIWYLERLQKGRLITGIFELTSLVISITPGFLLFYLLFYLLRKALRALIPRERAQHA